MFFNDVSTSSSIIDEPIPLAMSPDASEAVSAIGGVAGLLKEYGPLIVILAVFILVFLGVIVFIVRSNNASNKQMLDAQKSAIELNQQMTKEMMTTMITLVTGGKASNKKDEDNEEDDDVDPPKKKQSKSEKKIIASYIDSNLAFKDASRIAISKIHCERIAIYLLHNGSHSPYGYSFAKMSCVHEWTARGSNTIRGTNHVNIPLYAFSNIINGLVHDGEYAISNTYDHGILSADEQVFQFISGSSTRALFALAIKDDDGDLAAFTIAEFKDPQDFASAETYKGVKGALKDMNDNIVSIVLNKKFRDDHAEKVHAEDS